MSDERPKDEPIQRQIEACARNVVNQILDEAGTDVPTRQRINDMCDVFAIKLIGALVAAPAAEDVPQQERGTCEVAMLDMHDGGRTRPCGNLLPCVDHSECEVRVYSEMPCGNPLPCADHPIIAPSDAPHTCGAGKDGECNQTWCPQLRDGEPKRSGRHCPLDRASDERADEAKG